MAFQKESYTESEKPASESKLPVKEKLAWGGGEVGNRYGENGINDVSNTIYGFILGLSPDLIGIVLTVVRLWDAITDPIMGALSDNWKGKSGRRKPFILLGSILMTITYPLVWMASPDWSDNAKFIYFLCFAIIFFTCYTIYSVAYRALGAELTPDYEERITVRVYGATFNKVFMLFLPWVVPIALRDSLFPDPVTGIRIMVTIAAIFIVIFGVICARVPQERYQKIASGQERIKIIPSLKSLMKDKVFLIMHAVGIGLLSSILMYWAVGVYVITYYVLQGDLQKGTTWSAITSNILTVLSFVMLFAIQKYLLHFDKKKLVNVALLLAFVGSVARWYTFNQEMPWLMIFDPFFFGPAYALFWVVWLSMAGDFCDYDEHRRGKRREGIYSAVGGWLMKAASSLTFAVGGFLVVWTGYEQELGADQPDGTLTKLRLVFIVLPAVLLFIAIIMNAIYPLTKERMAIIRQELEERRGAA